MSALLTPSSGSEQEWNSANRSGDDSESDWWLTFTQSSVNNNCPTLSASAHYAQYLYQYDGDQVMDQSDGCDVKLTSNEQQWVDYQLIKLNDDQTMQDYTECGVCGEYEECTSDKLSEFFCDSCWWQWKTEIISREELDSDYVWFQILNLCAVWLIPVWIVSLIYLKLTLAYCSYKLTKR